MARNFRELENKMSPESRDRAKNRAREMMTEMLLSELRKSAGVTQKELASSLGIKQATGEPFRLTPEELRQLARKAKGIDPERLVVKIRWASAPCGVRRPSCELLVRVSR